MLFAGASAHRHILAVTFTNKATGEMKSRIIRELYVLAARHPSAYLRMLSGEYRLSEEQVRQQARAILTDILHDYASFHISTIDRFFQQTLRAFTREIGLQGGYGIEMDQEMILAEAVDHLLVGLDKPENRNLLGWLLRFAEERVEGGGEWDLRGEILSLAREVFKESYKAESEQIGEDIRDKSALEDYKNELYALIRSFEARLKALGEKGLAILDRYALAPTDFKNAGRSPLLYLGKYAAGERTDPPATFVALEDTLEAYYTRSAPPEKIRRIESAYHDGLNACVREILALFRDPAWHTAREAVRYYYTLGILGDVALRIADYCRQKNVLMIADTTELLHKIIDGSDTPFLYEKTGTRIEHYLMDEFQDTSDMQWRNFRPLIAESLAHRCDNLIVGDVKQSIYRFRNSNWKLLEEQVRREFPADQVGEETLVENWRSFPGIVRFNNHVFRFAPALLQSHYNETLSASSLLEELRLPFRTAILSAYKDCEQIPAPMFRESEGHVHVEFIPEGDSDEADGKGEALGRLFATLEALQDRGYGLKDIAILVRTNREGALVANALLAYGEEHKGGPYRYDMLSDDALYVNRSAAVRLLVAVLRYLKNPASETMRRRALLSFAALTGDFSLIAGGFPRDMAAALGELSHQALYEMIEGLFRLFEPVFPAGEQVFVQAFLDLSLEFSLRGASDLERFLKWWDDAGVKRTLATPEGQDAIRILTIHKSKGLGFKAVILPFGDWEMDHRPTQTVVLWCRPRVAPFKRLHLLPVRYGQALARTHFAEDYFRERLHACIDSLNTLYVAFTRARQELIVFAPRPAVASSKGGGKTPQPASTAHLLWAVLEGHPDFDASAGVLDTGLPSFSPPLDEAKAEEGGGEEEILLGRLPSVSSGERLRLSLRGRNYGFNDLERKHGILMHNILSRIRTRSDLPFAVDSFLSEGVIGKAEARELIASLEAALSHPEVQSWFGDSARVLNEVEILQGKERIRRPDRVMIFQDKAVVVDYKFGARETPQHHTQIQQYIHLLQQMGYTHVEGYLWYVTRSLVVRFPSAR
jgi:ATP-dependent exoDNAse (exonuclease V) beta subunit